MAKARGSLMSSSAASSFCRARTCGGTGGTKARCRSFLRSRAIASANKAARASTPPVHHTHAHGFGTATGGLIGRMSFVPATEVGGAGGGMRMPEFVAMLSWFLKAPVRTSLSLQRGENFPK